jgi:CHAT domain-containing protein/tetratricopeptide (TPR) repeat protein
VATRARVDSLRALGRYEEALLVARARAASVSGLPDAPPWESGDARRDVATLERIAALPLSDRTALAGADAARARADSLIRAGDEAVALSLLEAQLGVRRRVLGDRHIEVASSLASLVRLQLSRGDFRRATEMARGALAIRERTLGRVHPDVAQSYADLGGVLKATGARRDSALLQYQRSLALRRTLFGADAPETMESLLGIANMYRAMRKADSALVTFRHVIEQCRRREDDPRARAILPDALFSMAMTVTARGDWATAEPWLRESVERYRALGVTERISLVRALGSYGTALRHTGRARDALPILEECALIEEVHWAQAPPSAHRGLWLPLAAYQFLAAAQLECGRGHDAWVSLERAYGRSLYEQLAARGAIDTTAWWSHTLPRVQRALSDDAAAIGWLTVRPGAAGEEYPVWAYCVRRTGPVHWVRIDRPSPDAPRESDAALAAHAWEWRRAAGWPLRVTDARALSATARAAYDSRLAPLEPWLEGVRVLVVVSTDFSRGAPVESWMDRSETWLAEKYAIVYAPSALLFAASSTASMNRRRSPREWSGLLVDASGRSAPAPAQPLIAVNEEVTYVARRLSSASVLRGSHVADSLQALAYDGTLARFDLIHFAAHGVTDSLYVGDTALLLPASRDGGTMTVLLTPDIIRTSWNLDAELVTLSSCSSARGRAGLSEAIGFPSVLMAAGARHVLASLRDVDDEATSLLMRRFYDVLLQGTSHAPLERLFDEARALREARVWVRGWRAADGSQPFAHPVYWASFSLMTGGCAASAAN